MFLIDMENKEEEKEIRREERKANTQRTAKRLIKSIYSICYTYFALLFDRKKVKTHGSTSKL